MRESREALIRGVPFISLLKFWPKGLALIRPCSGEGAFSSVGAYSKELPPEGLFEELERSDEVLKNFREPRTKTMRIHVVIHKNFQICVLLVPVYLKISKNSGKKKLRTLQSQSLIPLFHIFPLKSHKILSRQNR